MSTLSYYDENAESFIRDTVNIPFHHLQDRFLSLLPKGAHILDFGCGSGRDSKYFLDKGYQVSAIDGCKAMCDFASQYTGLRVRHLLFQDFVAKESYHGIWACASILHLSAPELKAVLEKLADALVPKGILYTSFKRGRFEGEQHGRYFIHFDEESFTDFLAGVGGLSIIDMRNTADARPGRENEKWLNLLLEKV